MADNGEGVWDDLIREARDYLDGVSDDVSFRDVLHELYGLDRDLFQEAIYEITDDPAERHELWTAAMYE